jgi:WD40 repeat protein
LALSSRGSWLAWRDSRGEIGVRVPGRDRGIAIPHALTACQVGFAGEHTLAAVTCSGRLLTWDLRAVGVQELTRHSAHHCGGACAVTPTEIWQLAVDRERSEIATAGRDGTVAHVSWEATRRDQRLALGSTEGRAGAAFGVALAGPLVLVATRSTRALGFHRETGAQVLELPGHHEWVTSIAVAAPLGRPPSVLTADKAGTTRIWTLTGELRATIPAAKRALAIAVAPSGAIAATSTASGVVIFDVALGKALHHLDLKSGWTRRVIFVDDETLLAGVDSGAVVEIHARSGRVVRTLLAPTSRAALRAVYHLAVRGDRLLTASQDGYVRQWSLRAGTLERTYGPIGREAYVASWHPSGEWLVAGGDGGRICLWRVDREDCQLELRAAGAITAAEVVGDSKLITASLDGVVREWTLPPDAMAGPLGRDEIDALSRELARRAPACLDAEQRIAHLGESHAQAKARAARCGASPP